MEHFEKNSPKSSPPTNDPNNKAIFNPSQNVDADNARLMSMTLGDSILESNYKGKFSKDYEESTNLTPSPREWKQVKIVVRFSKKKLPIQTAPESSVRTFKGLIAQNCDIPIQQQLLIYKGCILKDDRTLQSYGLEADHAVYLICRSTPTDTKSGANSKDGGARSNVMGHLGNDVFVENFLEDEELQIREISDLGPLSDVPLVRNFINILEILRHLAMNRPELQELMQQHPELAYIYNGPRDHIVVSNMPNSTPLPNPWTPTITGWHGPPDLEGMEDDSARLNAGLSTLTRLMHYPSIYQMIMNILSDPETPKQVPADVTDHPYMEFIYLRETMQSLQLVSLLSSSMSSQQALPSEDFESESQDSGEQSEEDDGDTGTLVNMGLEMISNILAEVEAGSLIVPNVSNEREPSNEAHQILQPQEMGTLNFEENTRALISTSENVDVAVEQHLGNSEPPEIVYATQLSQLQEMGFLDAQENIRALIATSGNVYAAIERLQGNFGQ